ncbi:hypothetical protein BU26DRAFT_503946 [Trematosphaeria pertusa]|uniref:RING-type domain-containing protein n=1 Tax=Trematosphaeria pertusa TaxID=390896 RepID=A0A6A6ILX4_9PLEO|nr:uncharacterized protein BU26DRAFT_503946 [Trematosphaeria pertusa]KAF2251441.1 hypothetical protein BU26DRAFT_503946 [Trematosphaeria pertusa]
MEKTFALHNLTSYLRIYHVELASASVNERCFNCWRDFNTKYEDTNPDEIPCSPVRISPCGHVIGDECLKTLFLHGIQDCQLCRKPIKVKSHGAPVLLRLAAENSWYKSQSEKAARRAEERHQAARRRNEAAVPEYQQLCKHLFLGRLTIGNAFRLWCHQMLGCLPRLRVLGIVLALELASYTLAFLLPRPYRSFVSPFWGSGAEASCSLLVAILVFVLGWVVYSIAALVLVVWSWNPAQVQIPVGLENEIWNDTFGIVVGRLLTGVGGLSRAITTTIWNTVAFGAVTAALIALGMRRSKRRAVVEAGAA